MELNLNHQSQAIAYVAVTKCALFLILFFCCLPVCAQFSVTAATTPQTCAGNGSITVTPSGQTVGSSINYKIHSGPNASGPVIHNSANPTVGGQLAGTYYIVATEELNNAVIATANTTAVIANQTAPISFSLIKTTEHCNDGTITVNITAGSPSFYSITPLPSGTPVQQTNNVFTGLATGQYSVYVEDVCGDGDSEVITITHAYHELQISPPLFPDGELPACDKITVSNSITSINNTFIIYPLQATFTFYPPGGGAPVIQNVTINDGDEAFVAVEQITDYYYNDPTHKYTLSITDICGQTITTPLLTINPMPMASADFKNGDCLGKFLEVTPMKYVGPFTLEFIQFPPGFDPTDFNDAYPGPYTLGEGMPTVVFGDEENTLPEGTYQIQVYDACNRPIDILSAPFTIEKPEFIISAVPSEAFCGGTGKAIIDAMGQEFESVIIQSYTGPANYPTPKDVSDMLIADEPGIIITGLPPGEYVVLVVDKCGNVYNDPLTEFTINETSDNKADLSAMPDCEPGLGTLFIRGGFEHIEVVAAPAAYPHPLPHDITSYFNPDTPGISMDGLPPGQYKFKGSNACDSDIEFRPAQVTVLGLNEGTSTYEVTPNCGSFNVLFTNGSNGTAFIKFGLQVFDEDLNAWTNPDNGVVHADGEKLVPGDGPEDNAVELFEGVLNSDLSYPSGKYRIIKQYQSYAALGSEKHVKYCHDTYEFDYLSEISIEGAVSLACAGNNGDVQIIAYGVPPINYEIITKDGNPFTVDNGESSIFTGLESAVYTVKVTDECSQRTLTFNVADLPPLVTAPDPEDLPSTEICDSKDDDKELFDISGYTSLILGTQNPDNVTVTYYFSQSDADAGINAIADATAVETGTATIYARAVHEINDDCIAFTNFDLIVKPLPQIDMKDIWAGCEGNDVTIIAEPGFEYYEWKQEGSTFFLVGPDRITVSDPGKYTVTVRDENSCENSKTVEVIQSPLPKISNVVIEDWTDNSNILTVVMEPTQIPSAYEFSIDGVNYQDSPVFLGLKPGQYTIYVKDVYECGSDKWPTYILMYPKFFTPNGDNINDYWKIKFSTLEPDMLVYVYDRYGKLITGFGADSKGWDGTLNGTRLPATDYWFVVKRQNGEELRGHFSMLR